MLFGTPRQTTAASLALLLLRVVAGVAFMMHGWGKIQNPFNWMGDSLPGFLQALAALSEFGGGLAWILGLLTPLASLGILSTMAVAVYKHAIEWGHPFAAAEKSYELAAIYLVIAVVLMAVGAGKLSLDRLFFGEKK